MSAATAVRLQLPTLAYNLAADQDWSLTSLREKQIGVGIRLVSHGRYVAFPMAEVAVRGGWSPRSCD